MVLNTKKQEKKRAKQMDVIVNETNTFLKDVEVSNPVVSISIFVNTVKILFHKL